jgi:hypothetical protein
MEQQDVGRTLALCGKFCRTNSRGKQADGRFRKAIRG